MRRVLVAYAATLVAFLAVDSVWLSLAASRLYQPLIGPLLAPQPDLVAALAFYLVYIAGVVGFAVLPAARPATALLRGAAFGFVAYATYDLTNQATLKDWPLVLTIVDLCWGTALTAVASFAGARVAALTRMSARA